MINILYLIYRTLIHTLIHLNTRPYRGNNRHDQRDRRDRRNY